MATFRANEVGDVGAGVINGDIEFNAVVNDETRSIHRHISVRVVWANDIG